MEHERNQLASRDDILKGVYEDNKRIGDRFQPRTYRSNKTFVTSAGSAILLVIVLFVTMKYVLGDPQSGDGLGNSGLGSSESIALSDANLSSGIPIRPDPEISSNFVSSKNEFDGAGTADVIASSPVPITELFHLGVRTIVIDAGHGGRDPGALGSGGLMEKEITLDVAQRLARRLVDRHGLRVVLTREKDETKSLKERAEYSNQQGADLFISIHINQFPEEPVYALETFYFGRESSAAALRLAALENESSDYGVTEFSQMIQRIGDRVKLEESKRLAEHVQRSLFRNTRHLNEQVRNWGVKTAPFVVLVGAEAPGILAEIGVISNGEEETRLGTPEYREKLSLFLEEGIVTYLNELSDQEALQNGATKYATEEEVDD